MPDPGRPGTGATSGLPVHVLMCLYPRYRGKGAGSALADAVLSHPTMAGRQHGRVATSSRERRHVVCTPRSPLQRPSTRV